MTRTATVKIGSHEIAIYGWTLGGVPQPVSDWPITPQEIERRAAAKAAEWRMDPSSIKRADAIWMLTTGLGEIEGMCWSHDESTMTEREQCDTADAARVETLDASGHPDRV